MNHSETKLDRNKVKNEILEVFFTPFFPISLYRRQYVEQKWKYFGTESLFSFQ